uniref:G protein, Alpha subunit family member n=1 Tax=Hirondellea gigas TaxID=1518452 RepID=A0A6A7GCG1_9CRUS
MGVCFSTLTPEEKREKDRCRVIEKENQRNQDREELVKKLLLLGAGESGKSTLFKQMITLYGSGYSLEDRQGYINIVYNNTISAIKILVKYSDELADDYRDDSFRVYNANAMSKQALQYCKLDSDIDVNLAKHIQILWNDGGIRKTYAYRSRFQLPDSAEYFFLRASFIGQPDYIPTQQDILRSRVRTTGIVETNFEIEKSQFRMFDVGGQRNERKKWIHCFEDVTAVIFVAAISEYDQVLYEDETTNRVHEALDLFGEICNSRWFGETSVILFLNKCDLFQEKIEHIPLTVCFADYYGTPNSYQEGVAFFRDQFEAKNRPPTRDKIYTHVTCATDSKNVQHVFDAVKDTIIKQSLVDAGLMASPDRMQQRPSQFNMR